jgi:3-oxoadipate enol-lactonase
MIQHIQANGINIAYQFDGPTNAPVVIMSNSLMSSLAMWDDTLPVLTNKYRVLRYDTRGHGKTQVTPGPYNIALLAQDLVGLMDALKISKAHLVGLSMGGMICQYIGANQMPPRSLWEDRFATARKDGIAGLAEGTLKRWFVEGFAAKAPGKIEIVRKMILGTSLEGYLGCASAVRDMAQTTMLLKIKAPTLVLVGAQDPACTVDQATVLHRMIAQSKMFIIDNAAHIANIEQPHAFNQILREFLDSVSE